MDTTADSTGSGSVRVEAYCVHCRSRRFMQGAIQVSNRRGGRDLKGHCSVCGKGMYRLGGWESLATHDNPPPLTNGEPS